MKTGKQLAEELRARKREILQQARKGGGYPHKDKPVIEGQHTFSLSEKIIVEVGIENEIIQRKVKALYDKWMRDEVVDSEASRIICPILRKYLNNPVTLAIIGDSLSFFQKNESQIHPTIALQLACFAGSRDIGNYIINKYSCIASDFILPFAVSSDNKNWVMELAREQISKGVKFSQRVYLYGDREMAEQLERMFSTSFVIGNSIGESLSPSPEKPGSPIIHQAILKTAQQSQLPSPIQSSSEDEAVSTVIDSPQLTAFVINCSPEDFVAFQSKVRKAKACIDALPAKKQRKPTPQDGDV